MPEEPPKKYVGRELEFYTRYKDSIQPNRERLQAVHDWLQSQVQEFQAAIDETAAAPASEKNLMFLKSYTTQRDAMIGTVTATRDQIAAFDDMFVAVTELRNAVAGLRSAEWKFPDIDGLGGFAS